MIPVLAYKPQSADKGSTSLDYTDELVNFVLRDVMKDIVSIEREEAVGGRDVPSYKSTLTDLDQVECIKE